MMSLSVIGLISLAGTPATIVFSIFTPPQTVAFAPIHTLLPIVIGFDVSKPRFLCSATTGCPAQVRITPGAMKHMSPIVIGLVSRKVTPKFT